MLSVFSHELQRCPQSAVYLKCAINLRSHFRENGMHPNFLKCNRQASTVPERDHSEAQSKIERVRESGGDGAKHANQAG